MEAGAATFKEGRGVQATLRWIKENRARRVKETLRWIKEIRGRNKEDGENRRTSQRNKMKKFFSAR